MFTNSSPFLLVYLQRKYNIFTFIFFRVLRTLHGILHILYVDLQKKNWHFDMTPSTINQYYVPVTVDTLFYIVDIRVYDGAK